MLIKNQHKPFITQNKIDVVSPEKYYIKLPVIKNYKYNKNKPKFNNCVFCVTNTDDLESIFTFVFYHKIIINFDKVVIADNRSSLKLYNLTKLFDNVEYFDARIYNSQSEIYNIYLQNHNNSKYITFIDDDEYYYISDKYHNDINNFLNSVNTPSYKIAIPWILMYSKELYNIRNCNILNFSQYYCEDEEIYDLNNNIWPSNYIKTILNTQNETVHYFHDDNTNCNTYKSVIEMEETNLIDNTNDLEYNYRPIGQTNRVELFFDALGTVHNPLSIKDKHFILCDDLCTDKKLIGIKRNLNNRFYIDNSDILLLHYKYRSMNEYYSKITKQRFNDIDKNYYSTVFNKNYIINQYKKPRILFDKVSVLFNKYVNSYNTLFEKVKKVC